MTSSDVEWNQYLKKYADIYQIRTNGDREWVLRCKGGLGRNNVSLYSLKDKLLLFYFESENVRNPRKRIEKKLKALKVWFKITQQGAIPTEYHPETKEFLQLGYFETYFCFQETDLPKLAKLFRVAKKPRFTPEVRAKQAERMRNYHQTQAQELQQ